MLSPLIQRLQRHSPLPRRAVATIYSALADTGTGTTSVFAGADDDADDDVAADVAADVGRDGGWRSRLDGEDDGEIDEQRARLAVQVFFVFAALTIARAAVEARVSESPPAPTSPPTPTAAAAAAAAANARIVDTMSGAFFQRHGINNLPGRDVMTATPAHAALVGHWMREPSAPAEADRVADVLAEVDAMVQAFDFSPLVAAEAPERPMRDWLKALHHDWLPRRTRHARGEFYTPDWLAEWTVNQLVPAEAPTVPWTLLDPACGSGTFLVTAMRRWLDSYAGPTAPPEMSEAIWSAVVGFDVNPVAVVAARVNWLVAVLPWWRPEIGISREIPVRCVDVVGEAATETDDARNDTFDFIAGNPPWVQWETLSAADRRESAPLWRRYGLFVHRGMDAILGTGKKDFSTLITAIALDRWLKPGGKLAFVITQSVWKAPGAAAGFRALTLPDDTPVGFLRIDDFSNLTIFAGAATRPSVFVAEKSRSTPFPVPYTTWQPHAGSKTVASDATVAGVEAATQRLEMAAKPLGNRQSPWVIAPKSTFTVLEKILGTSDYVAREGVNTGGANGIFWIELITEHGNGYATVRNMAHAGRNRTLPIVTATIETTHIRPLIRPRDLQPWLATPSAHILFVQDPIARRGIALDTLAATAPATLAFLRAFEQPLRQRAAFRRYYTRPKSPRRTPESDTERDAGVRETGAFYSMFNVGRYTVAPAKAVWPRMGTWLFAAAVASTEPIPQETLCFVPTESPAEAHFIAAMVNSAPFQAALRAVSAVGGKSFGSPHILRTIRLPRFDTTVASHAQLATLAAEIAATAAATAPSFTPPPTAHPALACSAALDALCADAWGLSAAEIAAVHVTEVRSPT